MLIDFGFSLRQTEADSYVPGEPHGTFEYMAPEIVDKHTGALDSPMDIWSLGVTILEMVLKVDEYCFPFGWDNAANKRKIRTGSFVDEITIPSLQDLLRKVCTIYALVHIY